MSENLILMSIYHASIFLASSSERLRLLIIYNQTLVSPCEYRNMPEQACLKMNTRFNIKMLLKPDYEPSLFISALICPLFFECKTD